MTRIQERGLKAVFLTLIAVLAMLISFDQGPHFRGARADAAETVAWINYGGGNGLGNLNYAPVWSMSAKDTAGLPVSTVTFQSDCNLVLYRRNTNGSTSVLWASNTVRPIGTPCTFVLQADGNAVIYNGSFGAIWATGTNFGSAYKYQFDVYSFGRVSVWQYENGYGWHSRWFRPCGGRL